MLGKRLEKSKGIEIPFIGSLLRDRDSINAFLLLVAFSVLLTVLSVISIYMVRDTGLHIPGNRGLILMSLLATSKLKGEFDLSATYVAIFSSVETMVLLPIIGNLNMFYFASIIIPAVALDTLWFMAGKFYTKQLPTVIIALMSSFAYMAMLPFLMVSWYFGTGLYLSSHFAFSAILFLFLLFGAAGGVLGTLASKNYLSGNGINPNK